MGRHPRLERNIDRVSFLATVGFILLASVPLFYAPDVGADLLQSAYDYVASNFGVLYGLAGCATLVLLLYLALGRYSSVRLGEETEPPEFGIFSWAGMLFCAGVGAGLMYWSAIEWAFYYQSPPFGAMPCSVEAAQWASSYGVFHWGVTAWAFYCLPTLAIAYPYYVKKVPLLKFSTGFHHFIKNSPDGICARFIDFLFMIALIGGAASSLGFSTPLIAALVARLTGSEATFSMEVILVVICVLIFSVSVYLGLERGIKRLSDTNVFLALALVGFVLVAGPTGFLLKTAAESLTTITLNFFRMNTWSDRKFFQDWTVFYWAWWIAYGPFVGLFVTRISRGRTIREVVFGMLGFGSLGGALFYFTLGSYCFHQELANNVDVLSLVQQERSNQAIITCLDQLPLAEPFLALFCLVCMIFSATTYDSASYILAANATRELQAGEDPPRWHRCFWSFALALMPLALMYVGGLKVAQTAVLITSLPILLVGIIMSVALMRSLGEHAASSTDSQ